MEDFKCTEVKTTKVMNANRFFWDSWLKIWKNHLFPSMGPNWSVALDTRAMCRIGRVIFSPTENVYNT